MPPKQATLGKFFGIRNGVEAKKQQSTLAFHSPLKSDKQGKKARKGAGPKEETRQDVDEETKMINGIGEDEASSMENDGGCENVKAEIEQVADEVEAKSEIISSSPKRKAPRSPDEEDEEDEEPVRKRSRKGRASESVSASTAKKVKYRRIVIPNRTQAASKNTSKKGASTGAEDVPSKSPEKSLRKEPSLSPERNEKSESELEASEDDEGDEDKTEPIDKARETIQATLKGSGKDPYPDWRPGEPTPYAALCTTFSLIEMTTKRLQITAHCALFLRQVLRLTPSDLLPTIHLMTNKLAADYAGIELGIGESLIMKAIGEATGRSLGIIKQDQNEIGDLGLVAAKSRSTQPTMFKPKALTVKGVFDSLMGIATVQGSGSQQRKVDGIKKLLSAADAAHAGKGSKGIDITQDKGGPSEAKFIVRALEGKLRLGLAEKTVPVALAQAVVIHESEQKSGKPPGSDKLAMGEEIIKTVYSELPNYEVIIPAMIQHGIFNLKENCKLEPGVPLKPMLAKPTKSITEVLDRFEGKTFTCEYKYDGERAQIHYVAKDSPQQYGANNPALKKDATPNGISAIFSRNSEDLSKKYPDILAKLHSWIKPETKSFVLDCETVAWDIVEKKVLPFQQLMTRKRKDVKVEDVKVKVCVFAFDLLFHNGESITKSSLRDRRSILHSSFIPVDGEFSFAQHGDTSDIDSIQTLLDESVKASCEGLMVKMLDTGESGYEPSKRSRNWLKVKKDYLQGIGDSLDLVVLGAYYGKGKRTSVYGAFLLASYNANKECYETVCNIGTGFSETVLEELYADLSQLVIEKPKPFYTHSGVPKDQPDVWFEPRRVWEVKCADLTLSPRYKAGADDVGGVGKGVSLRFPRYMKGRPDKTPEQATGSRQVVEMYRQQETVGKNKGPSVDDDFEY